MGAMASQITSLTIGYSTVSSGADQGKHQNSASLDFVWGIHRWPVNSPHKWPATRKMFPFDDVIMHHIFSVQYYSQIPTLRITDPFVRGTYRSLMDTFTEDLQCGVLMFSLISASTWTDYRVTDDFTHHGAHVTSVQWDMNVTSNTPSNLRILE